MSAEENKAVARRYFEEFCTGRRLDLAEELMTADSALHDPQIPGIQGPRAIAEVIRVYQEAVQGHWRVDDVRAAEGDHVVVRWTGSGRHTGEVMGLAPTGRSVEISAISLFRMEGGKNAEHWEVWDTLGFLQQLGAVPEPQRGGPG